MSDELRTTYLRKSPDGVAYYDPVMVGPETIRQASTDARTLREVVRVLTLLERDDYSAYLQDYYNSGLERFGDGWRYSDICTVLLAAARIIAPRRYLEIGVRRGRSMAMVASQQPAVDIVGFDMWVANYAGMENPGADFVRTEMARVGHRGSLTLVSGDSHATVPEHLAASTTAQYDLITVDGDHSADGALADLRTVLPRLSVGGAIVFDDIAHPQHAYLRDVWRRACREDGGLVAHEFAELGYGVAFAVRARPAGDVRQRMRRFAGARGVLRELRRRLR